ncbi:MlaE family ABC transporter permease [Thalassospira alkalitolerans]|uniref:MlaE family ABC transporter permease n=2 Tax=Thalassospira alkalitolerans TaxID=1293890 RepID=UPI003AA7CBDD
MMQDRHKEVSENSQAENLGAHRWTMHRENGQVVVVISGDWIAREGGMSVGAADHILGHDADTAEKISFDVKDVGRWDSGLIAFLWELRSGAAARDMVFDDAALPASARRLLALASANEIDVDVPADNSSLSHQLGGWVIGLGGKIFGGIEFFGDVLLGSVVGLRGQLKMRAVDLLDCILDAGSLALPIVTIVNFLVGGILAFVGAVQLSRFGAEIFVANLVGIAVVREMAAVMTGIVMAGRTGGAYAAHIATMQSNEEIDALNVIGIPVRDYLILPRVLALTAMMPLLYLYGCAIGILGGLTVAVGMLDLTPTAFFEQIRLAISGSQFLFGFGKSIVFGALVAIVGCRIGLQAGRSAADVGRAATSAVVIGIVGVIAVDAIFAICANAVGF